jgi:hypothetical protein
MKMKRVVTGGLYYFYPVMLDQFHPTQKNTGLRVGERVKVIQPYGCPKNGTMGQCYIGKADTGEFIGMVCCNSLQKTHPANAAEYASL